MDRFFHRLFVVLVAAALTLVPGVVFAQAAPNLPVPVHAAAQYASPSGLQSTVTFDARGLGGAANAGHYSRPVLVSNNTLGGLGRGLAKRTLPSLAFLAALEAAGWAIDELTRQVNSDPGVVGAPIPEGTPYFVYSSPTGPKYFASEGSIKAYLIGVHNGEQPSWFQVSSLRTHQVSETSYTFYAEKDTVYGWASVGYAASRYALAPANISEPSTAPTPATDSAIADLIKANPNVWHDALHNSDGSVNRNPDVMAASQALAAELAGTDPAQQPSSDQGWDSGQQYGDEPSSNAGDLPAACTWFAKLCEWIDWTQSDAILDDGEDEYEIPTIDPLEDAPTWNSGLGAGSCPAPRTLETFIGVVTVPFDIFCQLAAAIRGLILAAAYASAAFILLGVRRG